MIDHEIKELINRALDGLLSPSEEQDLKRYLAQNKEAEKYYNELLQTVRLLDQVPQVEPPSTLKNKIMSELDTGRYRSRVKNRKHFRLLPMAEWWQNLRYRPAYVFALGLFLGILIITPAILYFFNFRQASTISLSGTMKAFRQNEFKIIQQTPIELQQVSGNLILEKTADHAAISISLTPENEIDLILEYDMSQVIFDFFVPKNDGNFLFSRHSNRIQLKTNHPLQISFFFIQNEAHSSFRIHILSSGQTLVRRTLTL